uniref:DAGKc domain-containing protein n=1 Tax=Panagrellus redivivus TaxID=6233 RepID=A0A7E4VG39_PANRE
MGLRYILCCGCCRKSGGDNGSDFAPEVPPPIGRVLVFVNPHSGTGKALQVYKKQLDPRLTDANIDHELIVTKHSGHARDVVVERTDLATFNAIIIVSGDGLVFEVINGLLERPDGDFLLQKLAFGVVPSGSGNGLLASLCYARGLPQKQPLFTRNAIEHVTDSDAIAYGINLTHMQTDTKHFASFMSIGWGLLADIDIESERFRKVLGSQRFTFEAVLRIFGHLRTYQGRLSFLEAGPIESRPPAQFNVYSKTPLPDESCPSYHSRETSAASDSHSGCQNDQFWQGKHRKPEASIVSPLGEAVDSKWTVIEGEFLFVYVTSVTHISPGNMYAPSAKLSDDRIQLTYALKKDLPSRFALAKFLDAIESAKHLDFDFVKTVSVTSFRLEPDNAKPSSYIVVDGEIIDCKRIQGTVSDVHIHLMSK